jgi:hypothetical protein
MSLLCFQTMVVKLPQFLVSEVKNIFQSLVTSFLPPTTTQCATSPVSLALTLKMETVCSSETLILFYHNAQCHDPEDCN